MTDPRPFNVLYLYPDEMNFYGDIGNVLAIQRRLEWRGFNAHVFKHRVGDKLPIDVDIIIGGGGQDVGQKKIYADLLRISDEIHALADALVPMVMVCGLYQLFGKRFVMNNRQSLQGIELFDAETYASSRRFIGNIITETEFGKLVGFENHSGRTILGGKQLPFGRVSRGYGNNESRKTEGAVTKNVYGTYLHGAVLPKNPKFADSLILKMLENRGEDVTDLHTLDDSLAAKIHKYIETK